jgi:ribosomal protein S18 acetylase RimI-like enzyme
MQPVGEPNDHRIYLRPVVLPDDEAFLQKLYFSTRDDLRGLLGDEQQERQLMLFQYEGQKATYAQEFPESTHDIIFFEDLPVGRLMVSRSDDVIHGVDLAVLPEYRNRGVGTEILKRLFAEAARQKVPFRISVVRSNPAISLYLRLGLRVTGETPTHLIMMWSDNVGND